MQVKLQILRFDPSRDKKPRWENFLVEGEPTDRLLDALFKVKAQHDGTLTLRSSCAHGICGSDAMKINGANGLACKKLLKDLAQPIVVEPLPGFRVIKDLVVDIEPFWEKYQAVLPYVVTRGRFPEAETVQTPEEAARYEDTTKCILCASCTSSCPSFWADPDYLGPAAIVQAHRFLFDGRDQGKRERLEALNGPHGIWRCRTIFNCTDCCPRAIEVTRAIADVKRLLALGARPPRPAKK